MKAVKSNIFLPLNRYIFLFRSVGFLRAIFIQNPRLRPIFVFEGSSDCYVKDDVTAVGIKEA